MPAVIRSVHHALLSSSIRFSMAFILADFARLCNDGFRAKCAFTIIIEITRRGNTESDADSHAIAAQAAQAWNEKRSAIEIKADDERDVRLFDSNDFIIPSSSPETGRARASSLYLWNAMGFFPVSGRNLMLEMCEEAVRMP